MKKNITFSSKGVPIVRGIPRTMRLCVLLIMGMLGWLGLGNAELSAQISVTATAGTVGPTSYTTLKGAFDAINAGTHQGAITVNISANTTETAPCVLNSSGAGTALYTSVLVQPTTDGVTVSGATVSGRGLVELNGADNVTINGDNPNTACVNRNLTFTNTAAATTTYTSVIRIALSTLITSANNNTVKNCIMVGSAVDRNVSTITGTTTAANTTWGIIATAGASTVSATTAPNALTSVTTVAASGQTATNLLIDNNELYNVARGIAVQGSSTTVFGNLAITKNKVGRSNTLSSIYSMGITVTGATSPLISGNTILNVQSYVATNIRGIDIGSINPNVTGAIVEKNDISGIVDLVDSAGGYGVYGISLAGGNNHIVRNNCISNLNNLTSGSSLSSTFGASGIYISTGTGIQVYNNSVNMNNAHPLSGSGGYHITADLCIVSSSSTGLDVRNNLFANSSTTGGVNGARTCIYLPSGATSTMNLTLNNNAYYAPTTNQIGQAGTIFGTGVYTTANFVQGATTPATNLRAYTSTLSAAGTNDNASWAFSTAAPFTSATDLHIPNGTVSVLESGGAALAGVSPEMDNDIRPGPRYSLNGGALTPDIGCDEFDGYRAGCGTLPAASVTASPVSGSTCANGNPSKVTLTASGGATYDWSPSIGLSAITGATVDATPSTTTIYTVTVTDAAGCKATATQLVDVPINLTVTATPPSVCASDPNTQLLAAVSDSCSYYKMSSIAHAPIADPGGSTTITTWTGGTNDGASTAITLPFTFKYYCNDYTNVYVSNNGYISFNDLSSLTATESKTAQTIASSGNPNNLIALCMSDLNIGAGGTIKYYTTGTTPNQVFVVDFTDVPFATCAGLVSGQIQLYETTNNVEVHITNVTHGTATYYNTMGIENSGGTVGASPHSRNNTRWDAVAEAWRFEYSRLTYAWASDPTLSATNIKNPTANNLTANTTYTVTVTSSNGCTATRSITVSFAGSITLSPTATPATICAGQSSTLASGATGGSGTYTYTWNDGVSDFSTLASPVVSPTVTTTYTLTVSDNCSPANSSTSTVTITVNPLPDTAITPTTPLICGTGSVTLTVASGGSTYAWSPSIGLSSTNTAVVTASPTTTTVYTVTVTSTAGCSSTASVTVTVAPAYSIAASATPTAVCSGANSQLNVAAGTTPTYTVAANTLNPVSTTGLTAGSYTTVPSGDDVVSNSVPIGFDFTFYGNTYTTFQVSTNGNIQFGGSASSVYTPATAPAASVPNNYIALAWRDWTTVGAGEINYYTTGTAPNRLLIVDFNDAGNYVGQIILHETTNVVDIISTNIGTQTSVQGIENATGTAGLAAPSRNNVSWSSTSVSSYTFTPSFTGGTYTYQWSPTTFITGQEATSNPLATAVTTTTIYTVTVTDALGCTATSSVTVTVDPLAATPTATPATICAGQSSTLAAGATGGGAPYTYLWSTTSTNASITVTPTSTTTYDVTVTDNCGTTTTGTVAVTVNPVPTAIITSNSPVCAGSDLNITLTTDGTTFGWAGPNSFTSTSQNPTITAATTAATGTYTVIVTSTAGCTITATTTVVVNPLPTVTASASPTIVCSGSSSTLTTTPGVVLPITTYTTASIAYAPVAVPGTGVTTLCNNGTQTVTLSSGSLDDGRWNNIALPFSFPFFSSTYSTISIGTNGVIGFGGDLGTAGGYGTAIPSTNIPNNIFAAFFADLDMDTAPLGGISYWTDGTAPNRRFIVNYNDVDFFSNTGSISIQAVIHENGKLETYVNAPAPDTDNTIIGVENSGGTVAFTATGINNVASNTLTYPLAWSFTPVQPNFTYAWSDPSSATTASVSVTPTATTTYTVTVTNTTTNCSTTTTVTVNVPTITAASNSAICAGSDLNLTSSPAGATTYAWAGPNGFTSAVQNPTITAATAAAAGTYTVTVTSAATPTTGCTATTTVVVNTPITAPILTDTTYCVGATATALDATTTDATAYLWSESSTTASITPSTATAGTTTYTVTVSGPASCPAVTATAAIVVNAPITAPILTDTTYCVGATATALDATTTDATAYLWSESSTTASITPSTATAGTTTYTVTVSAPTGCPAVTATAAIVVNAPITAPILTDTTYCVGATATALDATTTDATAYLWSESSTTASITPSTATAGTTTYTVTVSAPTGCTDVTATAAIVVNAPITAPILTDTTYCVGATATALDATTTDATAYLWSESSTTASITPSTATAGTTTYTVTVSAPTGCPAVTATAAIVVNAPITAPILTDTTYCVGATATALDATTTDATAYLWSESSTTASITPSTATAGTTTYTVTVSAPTGCTDVTANATVVVNDNPSIVSITNTPTGCSSPSGTATVSVSGGTSPYTYSWSDGQTTAIASALAVGTYTVAVSDANTCSAIGTTTIVAAGAPIATATSSPASLTICQGGAISVTFNVTNALVGEKFAVSFEFVSSAGTIPYGTLNNNATFTVGPFTEGVLFAGNVTLQNIIITSQTSNCSVALSDISFTVNPKPVVSIPATTVCFGATNGTLTANVTASTATPYTYSWNNTQTTNPATGLAAGTYTVTVTDSNTCSATASGTVTQPATALAAAPTTTGTTCNGSTGTATANATGGTSPYTYSWSNGQTSATATALAAGTYTVTVTDANSCTTTATATVTNTTNPPVASATPSATIICEDGSFNVSFTSDQNFNVSMTLNSTSGSFLYGANNKTSGFTTPNFTEGVLFDGTVTITGITITSVATGCITTLPDIIVTVNPKPTATVSTTPTCFGSTSGTATANASGGTPAYTYLWNTTETTQTITALGPATYFVTVSDAVGCTATANGNVIQGASLTATTATTSVSCFGGNDGTATVTPTGGIAPYTYNWSDGQTTATATNLTAGSYLVTITDGATCSTVANVTVAQPAAALAAGTPTTTPRTCTAADGTATVTPTGGTAPYTYNWSDGQTTATATGLNNTNYNVTVTDSKGCTAVTFATVGITPNPTPGASNNSPVCAGNDITLTGIGGTSYVWSGPSGFTSSSNPATLTAVTAAMNNNIYTVTVTDANGCTASTTTQITVYPLPAATAANSGAVCPGSSITLTATGGANYAWSGPNAYTATGTPATLSAVTYIQNGEVYTVTVTDANGCSSTATTTIVVNPQPAAPTTTDKSICQNEVLGTGQGLTASSPGLVFTSSAGSVSASNTTNGASFGTAYPGTPMNVVFPAAGAPGGVPTGATVTGVTVNITYTAINGSWMSELRTRITPPTGYNAQVNDIQPKTATNGTPGGASGTFTGVLDPNSNPTTAPAWPNADPAGTWTFDFRETFDDGGTGVQDANITNITIVANYSLTQNATLTWWDAPTGGTQVGSGTPFNPTTVPIASGGVDNTVIGSTTYYAQVTSLTTGCTSDRAAAVFTVDPPASADAGADVVCVDGTTPISVSGVFGGTASLGTWSSSGTGTFSNVQTSGTTVTADYTPSAADIAATNVTLTFTTDDPIGGCVAASDNIIVSFIPTAPTTTDYSTCPFVAPPTGQGLTATCPTSLAPIPNSSVTSQNFTSPYPGSTNTASDYSGSISTSVVVPPLPPNATVTGVTVTMTYNSINGGWRNEFRTRITPPATFGSQQTDLIASGSPPGSSGVWTGNFGTWGTNDPSGTWNFDFRATFDGTGQEQEVQNITITVNYTTPAMVPTWWTAASGGTQVGSGVIFDPTLVALPDGVDITQVGTTTYYAQCTSPNSCESTRTAADFIIESAIVIDAGADQNCLASTTTTINLSGSVSGLGVTTGTWSGGAGTFADATSLTTTYTPTTTEIEDGYIVLTLTSGDPTGPCGPVSDQIIITFNPPAPTATDYTICQYDAVPTGEGLDATCPSRPATPAIPGNITGSGTGGTSSATTYGGTGNNPIYVDIPSGSLPTGAIVNSVTVTTSYTALGTSFLSELRVQVTPPAQFGAAQTEIQLSTNAFAGILTNVPTGTFAALDPAGLWTFDFRETFDDANAGFGGTDASIDNITVTANYTIPADPGITYQVNWWDAATGGNLLAANVDPFNPTAIPIIAGGVDNTVPGTKTYYAECYNITGCGSERTAAVFTVNPLPVVEAGPAVLIACVGNDVALNGTVTIGTNAGTGTWSSTGTGTFGDASALSTAYTPSTDDYLAGTITLTLTSEDPAGPCGVVTDNIVIIFGQVTTSTNVVDAVCFGGTGTATVTALSGTAPYNYLWSNSGTDNAITAVAGTYSVTVTDDNGCSSISSATINEPTQLLATTATTDALCNGGDGSVDLTVSGGTSGYTYLWDDAAASTTEDLAAVPAGTYNVTITDANGCSTTATATVGQASSLVASATATDALCNGGSGSVDLTVSGGTSGYTYLWDDAAASTTEDLAAVPAGTYNVTITDANGCSTTAAATVGQASSLVASATATDALCNGGSGSVDLTVSGGTSGYTYLWDDAAASTTEDLAAVPAGTYNVTITDANGCSTTAAATVGQASSLVASATATDALCNGGSGSVDLTVSGGTSGYTYLWDDAAASTTEDLVAVPAGTYNVTITDANGCSTTATATVGQASSLVASATATDALCNGGSGSVDLTVSGGTSGYTYLWDDAAASTTEDLAAVPAGTYNVTITDANGCSTTAAATVSEPTALVASATATDALCNGGSGSVDLTVSGGTSGYTYLWDDAAASTTEDLAAVPAGTYNVTITDANGCSTTAAATVSEPTALVASATATDALCNGGSGSVDLTVSGGTSGYTYLWDDAAASTTEDLAAVPAGTYNVTITDANGCSTTAAATVSEPTALVASATATDALCNGGSGSVDLTVSGGTSGYTYLWDDAAASTTEDLVAVPAGTYNVTITDANGCSTTATATVGQASSLVASATATDALCNGGSGSVDLTVSGGTSGYTYLWDDAAASTTEDLVAVPAGTYNVTITDANGCSTTATATVGQASSLVASATATDALCNGGSGSVDLTVSGGTSGYTYLWDDAAASTTEDLAAVPAGTYNVTITDANGCSTTAAATVSEPTALVASATATDALCNGGSGSVDLTVSGGTSGYTYLWDDAAASTTEDLAAVPAGTYNVTITDANGCSTTAAATVSEPTALVASATATDALCNGGSGSVDLTVSGGTSGYTYLWDDAAASTTEDLVAVPAGTYNVTITDANGCSTTATATVGQASSLVASATATDALCNGGSGSVDLTVSGGTSGYTYLWDDAAASTTEDLVAVPAGTYNVTITDANGCSTTATATVGQASSLVASATATDALCNGGSGSVDLTVSGGTSGYTYLWDDAAASTTEDLAAVPAGTYNVTITDANGCSTTATATVGQASSLVASATATDALCNGGSGSVDLTVSGGTSGYTYLWDDAAASTTEDLAAVPAGTYNVTITDANGCSTTATATVGQASSLVASATATDALCNGGSGSVDLTVSGGTSGYTYLWDDAAASTTEDLAAVPAGTYNVTITDTRGCTITATVVVAEPTILSGNVTVTDALCNGGTGAIDATATGGTPSYAYDWSTGDTGASLTGVATGTYTVTITDGNGCTVELSGTVNEATALNISANVKDEDCPGSSTGSINLSVTGGSGGYSYAWNTGATTSGILNVVTGTYTVTVTDSNGCETSASYIVGGVAAPAISSVTVDCLPTGVGNVTVTATGSGLTYSIGSTPQTNNVFTNVANGTYVVTVTNVAGCTATTSVVVNCPPACPTAIASNNGPVCTGSPINLSVNPNLSSGVTATYSWIGPTGATSTLQNPVVLNATTAKAGTYSVTVTYSNGCTSVATTNVVVNVRPTATASASCTSGVGTITVTASGGTGLTYSIGGIPQTNNVFPNVANGTYTVTVTNSTGCTRTTTVTVNCVACSTATASNNGPVCTGSPINLSVNPNLSSGVTATYAWSGPAGTSTLQNPVIPNGTPSKAGIYSVTVTYSNGCTSVATTNVVVNPKPTVTISGVGLFCAGGSSTLAANSSITGTYAWSNGATTATTTVTTAGTYTVTVTTAGGCSATAAVSVATQNCCSASAGVVSATASCAGEPIVATAAGYNTDVAYAFYYLLVDDNGNIVANNTTGVFATTALTEGATYTVYGYSVRISPAGGANPPANGTALTALSGNCFAISASGASVTVGGTLIAPISGNTTEGGTDGGVSPFTYNTTIIEVVGGAAPYNFDWATDGYVRYDIVYTETGVTITVYYTDDASWSVTVTDSNNCNTGSLVFNNVPTGGNAILDIDSFAVTDAVDGDGAIALTVTGGDYSCGEYSYTWTGPETWSGNYAATGTGNYTINGLVSGWYAVTVTDCSGNTSEGWYWVPEGTRGRTKTVNSLAIVPNPTADHATVSFVVGVSGTTQVAAYSIEGKEVATLYKGETKAGELYQVGLDALHLPSGMYFVSLTNANGETTIQKVLIAR